MSRRVLYLANQLPSPADTGLRIRQRHLLEGYARAADVTLLAFGDAPGPDVDLPASIEVLPLATRALESSFEPQSRWRRRFAAMRGTRPLEAQLAFSPTMAARVEALAREVDLVHVSRLWMVVNAERALARSARPRFVLDLDDVETVASARRIARGGWRSAPLAAWDWVRVARYQRRALRAVDRVLVCSESDRARLGADNVIVVPNGATVTDTAPAAARDGRTLLFCGTLGWDQNVDALLFFVRRVLPRIVDTVPDARLLVVGKRPDARVRALHDGERVLVVPDVPAVEPYYAAATAAVVPLRIAGGTRLKILEAFALGTPVVSTTIGAEGLDVRDRAHLLLADTANAFARRCVEVLRDPALARRLSEEARRLVVGRYRWGAIEEHVAELARRLVDGLTPLAPAQRKPAAPAP